MVELVRQRLVEHEGRAPRGAWSRSVGRDGLGLGGIECRGLIEEEISLGRAARGRDGRRCVRQLEVKENRFLLTGDTLHAGTDTSVLEAFLRLLPTNATTIAILGNWEHRGDLSPSHLRRSFARRGSPSTDQ